MGKEQSREHLFLLMPPSFYPRLSLSLLPSLLSLNIVWLLPPASEQLPLLSLKKMKADESIWPVALKCTCLHPGLGGGGGGGG